MRRGVVGFSLIAILAGCGSRTDVSGGTKVNLAKGVKSLQSHIFPANGSCGLEGYPISRPTEQMVADAPRSVSGENSKMEARVEVDAGGRITHLKVLQLAYPGTKNTDAINARAVEAIKGWHYAPTLMHGQPVIVCSDVIVSLDSQ